MGEFIGNMPVAPGENSDEKIDQFVESKTRKLDGNVVYVDYGKELARDFSQPPNPDTGEHWPLTQNRATLERYNREKNRVQGTIYVGVEVGIVRE